VYKRAYPNWPPGLPVAGRAARGTREQLDAGVTTVRLAVDGDPSQDIGRLRSVRLVVAAGREHRRPA